MDRAPPRDMYIIKPDHSTRCKTPGMSATVLMLLSFVPALAIALYIYLRDMNEREPYGMLLLSMVYGGIAFFISRGIGFLLHSVIYTGDQGTMYKVISAFLFTGLLAELFKFLILRGVIFYYKAFNQPFDGIVYAVMVAMGYVIAGNSLLVFSGETETAALRMVTAAPAHAVFAVIMGFFLGQAKAHPARSVFFSLIALLAATFAHGLYDYFMQLANITGLWVQAGVSLVIVILLTQMAFKYRSSPPA